MDIEKEIEFLEILENTPTPPDPAPVPMERDGHVKVPFLIAEYFKKIEVDLNTDEQGRMKTEDYQALIDDYNIPTYGIKIITFKKASVEDLRGES